MLESRAGTPEGPGARGANKGEDVLRPQRASSRRPRLVRAPERRIDISSPRRVRRVRSWPAKNARTRVLSARAISPERAGVSTAQQRGAPKGRSCWRAVRPTTRVRAILRRRDTSWPRAAPLILARVRDVGPRRPPPGLAPGPAPGSGPGPLLLRSGPVRGRKEPRGGSEPKAHATTPTAPERRPERRSSGARPATAPKTPGRAPPGSGLLVPGSWLLAPGSWLLSGCCAATRWRCRRVTRALSSRHAGDALAGRAGSRRDARAVVRSRRWCLRETALLFRRAGSWTVMGGSHYHPRRGRSRAYGSRTRWGERAGRASTVRMQKEGRGAPTRRALSEVPAQGPLGGGLLAGTGNACRLDWWGHGRR